MLLQYPHFRPDNTSSAVQLFVVYSLGFSGNPRSNRKVPRDQVNDGAMLPSTNS